MDVLEAGGAPDPVLLLQTAIALGEAREMSKEGTDPVPSAEAAAPEAASNGTLPPPGAAPPRARWVHIGSLPLAVLPAPSRASSSIGKLRTAVSAGPQGLVVAAAHHSHTRTARSVASPVAYVLTGYLLFAYAVLLGMFWTLWTGLANRVRALHDHQPSRPEARAWRKGFFSWLSISWATDWILLYGQESRPSMERISAGNLGRAGDEANDAASASRAFERLWQEDIACRGSREMNLHRVLTRLCTGRRLLAACLSTAAYEVVAYVGPALAVEWTLECAAKLQAQESLGHDSDVPRGRLHETLAAMGVLTGLPMLLAFLGTMGFLSMSPLGVRVQAALTSAVLRKAQRLPSIVDSAGAKGQYSSPVQLAQSNAVGAIFMSQLAATRAVVALPILAFLSSALAARLGTAMLVAAGATLAALLIVVVATRMQGHRLSWFHTIAGVRLGFFREVVWGMQSVKCHAWEPAAQTIVSDIRAKEMDLLSSYFTWCGVLFLLFVVYPRVVVLSSLSSYISTYQRMSASDVFVMVQYLNAFKGAAQLFSSQLPHLLSVDPSLRRIDHFLKQPEAASNGGPEAEREGSWRSLWPKEERQHQQPPPALRLQGSFARGPDSPPALRDLDLQVERGELVAVIGDAGSGKSTLLRALLGELMPVGEARVEAPAKMAYHSQVPHTWETTLRENILFWSGCDDQRYTQAVHAACLLADMEAFPGGDSVLVGSRGMTLSASQAARVSLARVAYAEDADVCLLDDPFTAVDAATVRHLIDHLLTGPLLSGRTRIVVCQPDQLHLAPFDRVILLRDGGIAVQGSQGEVAQTLHFRSLLADDWRHPREQSLDAIEEEPEPSQTGAAGGRAPSPVDVHRPLEALDPHEDGLAGWPDVRTLRFFGALGRWRNVMGCATLFLFYAVCMQISDIVLADWAQSAASLQASGFAVQGGQAKLTAYFAFVVLGAGCFVGSWCFGKLFTLALSRDLHERLLQRVLHAPLDSFFNRTPVNRIMGRMSGDMSEVDLRLFLRFTAALGQWFVFLIPTVYIHMVTPVYFTVSCAPFYILLALMLRSYWRAMAQLWCLTNSTRSRVGMYMMDIEHSVVAVRAYQVSDALAEAQETAIDQMLQADFASSSARKWVVNRLLVMYSFFCTSVALLGILPEEPLNIGPLSLCLTSVVLLIGSIEPSLDMASAAQFGLPSMHRLQEYAEVEQEAPAELESDWKFRSPTISINRAALGNLKLEPICGGLCVMRHYCSIFPAPRSNPTPELELVLKPSHNGRSLVPPPGRTLASLAPECEALQQTAGWHRLVAANGAAGHAGRIAEELVWGTDPSVVLYLRSGWLADGARVVVSDLVVGYANVPMPVLKGVSLSVERRGRLALAGAAGCGKSALLLSVLRALELREGWISVEGVDIQSLGLQTLRRSLGYVPQDSVLFAGTFRTNLDPFNDHTDEQLQEALRLVHLDGHLKHLAAGLESPMLPQGANLSLGQRRQLCVARMALRQPGLLLVDEAPAAVDPQVRARLQVALRVGFPDSTIIAASHCAEAVMDFDEVAVMDSGRVVERGEPDVLARFSGSLFHRLLRAPRAARAAARRASAAVAARAAEA